MNSSGDAAEQVVRFSLEGTEVALRLTGSAAKNIAAALYTILKNRDKTKTAGRQRLTAMLKSGKELKVFTLPEEHLKQFTVEAKRYGVVYCALRGKEPSADGLVDIMVRTEDASKINRIVERFKLATVDAASIKHDSPAPRKQRHRQHRNRICPTRPRRIACWTISWALPPKRRNGKAQTPLRPGRKNPLCPRLPQRRSPKPPRVRLRSRRIVPLSGRI